MLFRGKNGRLPLEQVVRSFQQFAAETPDARLFIWVGTDSQEHGRNTRVVTSVTAYRERKGAQSYDYVQTIGRSMSL
ncbi:MAG: ribonuclease H-like YkuK family protein, partial [Heliobacteriaceae bacterium]|nr:ribonuclease H-like YkuK family protein [Heliobacteriaceae bacterium]